jgi:citrate synthase
MLTGTLPTERQAFAFDTAAILHMVHGMNASTFVARIITSTLADIYGAITGAISALDGPLHGGANQDVMEMLLAIKTTGEDPVDYVCQKMDQGERIPGFGSRAYAVKDPRGMILQHLLETVEAGNEDIEWSPYCTQIEQYMQEEKGLAANLDFYSAPLYNQLSIPVDLYTPIFALSRVGGWIGHVLEQREDNRLIRPRATYVGEPEREFVPVDER